MNKLPVISVDNLNSNLQLNQTMKLLRTIGSPLLPNEEPFVGGTESSELYDLAVKNKISLLYLRALKQRGKLSELKAKYDEEYAKYLKFLDGVNKASRILHAADIEYVIFKTVRPYPAVPGDVDILIMANNTGYIKANELFLKAGYKEWERNDLCPTLPDFINPEGNIIIDLQEELELSYVIYMDKSKLRGYIVKTEISFGEEIKTLTPELDLATMIIHSLTENLYLIGEFYTLLYALSGMNEREIDDFVSVLKENKITGAAQSFIAITVNLHEAAYDVVPKKLQYALDKLSYKRSEAGRLLKNNFKMPHRYGILTMIKVILEKMGERRFRRSVWVQMVKMLNPRLTGLMIVSVIERRKRAYYLKKTEA